LEAFARRSRLRECWAVSFEKNVIKPPTTINLLMLENTLARIRSDREPYLQGASLVYGLAAMDRWIEQMNTRPFCPDCFTAAPDREWTCANSTAEPVYEGALTVAEYLKGQMPEFSDTMHLELKAIIQHYEDIGELLEPALKSKDSLHYQAIIGNEQKQREHSEKVLQPVKQLLSKAADAIEKIINIPAGT